MESNTCPECMQQLTIDTESKYKDMVIYICSNHHRSIFLEGSTNA